MLGALNESGGPFKGSEASHRGSLVGLEGANDHVVKGTRWQRTAGSFCKLRPQS